MRSSSSDPIAYLEARLPFSSMPDKACEPKVALIFEESAPMREGLACILEELGFFAVAAQADLSFLENVRREAPDVIFASADRVPASESSKHDQEDGSVGKSKAVVVACGQRDDKGSIIRALSRGAEDYLIKPFDRTLLRSKLICLGLLA